MEDLSKLLKNFNIKFSNDINEFLKCTICKKVLVDAHISPCLCKFCLDCIEQHLKDGGRPCPGANDECKETFINSVNELEKDTIAGKQISVLLVECPNENCDNRCQLKKLPEHMRMCTKADVECVFSYVGCADGSVAYDKMKEHLDEKSVAHGRSLVAHIRNMENEMKERMDRYECALERLTTENAVLRQIGERNAVDIEQMKTEIQLMSSNEETLVQQNSALKGELNATREDVAMLRQTVDVNEKEMTKMKDKMRTILSRLADVEMKAEADVRRMQETLTRETAALKGELVASREDVAVLRQRLDKCDRRQADAENKMRQTSDGTAEKFTKMKEEIGSVSWNVRNFKFEWRIAEDDLKLRMKKHRAETDTLRRMQEDAVRRLDKLAAVVDGLNDFVWRIEGIRGKIGKWEYSREFLSDGTKGYKLCLFYGMDSSGGLYLTFRLMLGDDDYRLQWPMNRSVLIEIIDEQYAVPVMSRRVCLATATERNSPEDRKKAYNRPTSDINNYGDGFYGCMKHDQIKSTAGAIRNDSMTVRCRVLPQ